MPRHVFHDRHSAGALLGADVAKVELDHPVVLGLPRGGVREVIEIMAMATSSGRL